jgi:hypothetical protein
MSDRTVLPDLARSLSEQERRRLLSKIQNSISLNDSTEESIYHKEMEEDEREVMLKNDMERASLFIRLRLWLKRVFSGKDPKELFITLRLSQYKTKINQKTPGLVSFETRSLLPKCAEQFFSLYLSVMPLIKLFRSLWSSSKKYEHAITALIEKRVIDAKKTILNFMTLKDMEKIYAESSSKNVLKNKLIEEINGYVAGIEDSVFSELEEGIIPIYYLKDLVLFPYNELFKLFKVTYDAEDKSPNFKSASAFVALEYLEQMYYAVYLATKIDRNKKIDKDFTERLCDADDEDETDPCEDLKGREIGEIIPEILNEVTTFARKLPFVELIRFYHEDPYYQLIFYIPKLNIRDFYRSKLELDIIPQLDDYFPQVRKNVIDDKIEELFPNERLEPLLYYRDYSSVDYKRIGLPTFAYTRSINLMYNFIRSYYRKKIQNVIQILSQGLLRQNRLTLNRLLVHSAAIEDLQDKIKSFDNSLSSDEDDGKLFQRIRHSLATDAGHQRLYRSLLQQKDNEVRSLIEKGKESFLGIKKIFEEFLNSPEETVKQRLNTHYYVDNTSKRLKKVLAERSDHIEQFRSLLYEVAKIERGV